MPACVSYREHVCVIQRAAIAHHELKPQDIREKSHCIIEMMVFDLVTLVDFCHVIMLDFPSYFIFEF